MSTPEENFDIAVDGSSDDDARRQAIDDLEAANECDMLAEIVRESDVADEYRELALENLATPQCIVTLESLAEDSELSGTYQEQATALLRETPDDAGAGP